MKGLVLGGCGLMGKPITYGLQKLNYDVKTVDVVGGANFVVDSVTQLQSVLDKYRPDFCISAMPFSMNAKAASICVHSGVSWFDLGGHVPTTRIINHLPAKNCQILTDLGLAPGLVNILGLSLLKRYPNASKLGMYCGGIPSPLYKHSSGPLRYGLTWSAKGLVNEYMDRCDVLRNGKAITVDGMSEKEKLVFPDIGEVEAFHTSGGTGTLFLDDKNGISSLKECYYKTMRWPGHRDAVRSLLDIKNIDEIAHHLENVCPKFHNEPQKDMVLVYIKLEGVDYSSRPTHKFSASKLVQVFGDAKSKERNIGLLPSCKGDDAEYNQFSAMQKTTGFSCVSAVHCALNLNKDGVLGYSDICDKQFYNTLFQFGIKI